MDSENEDEEQQTKFTKSQNKKIWQTSLFSCFNDMEDFCFCCISLPCPSIGYGMNYSRAAIPKGQTPAASCYAPCCLHLCSDYIVSIITQSLHMGAACHLPFGCILRQNHRQTLAGYDAIKKPQGENIIHSLLVEIFCWSCSLAQVRREIKYHQGINSNGFKMPGNPYIGYFHSMVDASN